MKTEPVFVHLAEGDYVIIPRAEYLRLCGESAAPAGLLLADAKKAVMAEMSRRVRLARESRSLTQSALAKRLGVTQAMVSRAESGSARISGAYIGRVLKACKLPPDWTPAS
jgi:DNA-binding XRE family transcriptional regulator